MDFGLARWWWVCFGFFFFLSKKFELILAKVLWVLMNGYCRVTISWLKPK